MRLPPQNTSSPAASWVASSPARGVVVSSATPPSSSHLHQVVAPLSSRSNTPQRMERTFSRSTTPQDPSPRSSTPSRNSQQPPSFTRPPSPARNAFFLQQQQQQPPTSPDRSVYSSSSIQKSPTRQQLQQPQRVVPIVQQKQQPPPPQDAVGPSPTDYFRNRVKHQRTPNTTKPETTTTTTTTTKFFGSSTAGSSATTKSSSTTTNTTSGIPSSFPRTAPPSAKIHNNSSSSYQANSSTPLTTTPSAFHAARSAFGQTNTTTTTTTSPTEPDPPHIQRRHTFGTSSSSSSSKVGNKSTNRVEDNANSNNIKPQLTNAMKQVDTYYKKFLAQEMNMEQHDDEEVLSRSSTIVTQNDVRDELLERLQHEYVVHTQQITTLQQQLQEELLQKKQAELTFQTEQQRWQTKHDKIQQQWNDERLHDAQRITELETFCQQLQKELEEKQWTEGQGQQRVLELQHMCDRLQNELKDTTTAKKEDEEQRRTIAMLQQQLQDEKESRKLAERQVKKQAEEKYHELVLTCNSLKTQNEQLQQDILQKDDELLGLTNTSKQTIHMLQEQVLELQQQQQHQPDMRAVVPNEQAAEIKRLKQELQQMTERLELCREPQAVGDIKTKYESMIFRLEEEKEEVHNRLQTLEHTNSKLKMMIQEEAYAIGVEMVKLLNEEGETAGIMELEQEFGRAHSENQVLQQEAMPDVNKQPKPSNLTPDGKVKVDPEKLAKMKQQLIDLRVANARYEKQIAFVKGICDQVVESLRQELNDVEMEKANFEKDMLSQLTSMAHAKAAVEDDLTAKLDVSEQTVQSLKRKLKSMSNEGGSIRGGITESVDKLAAIEKERDELHIKVREQEDKIHELYDKLEAMKKTAPTLASAAKVPKQRREEELEKLENDIEDLREKLEESENKVLELRQTASEQKQIISTLSADLKMAERKVRKKGKSTKEDSEEVVEYLSRVSYIHDQATSSMEVLDGMLKQLKALEAMDENDSKYPNKGLRKDRQEVMSLLSKSKQVREEMKVSLQLIELNLMNQLESTRNESQMSSSSAPTHSVLEARDVAASFEQKSMQIREEARQSLHKTELDLLQKIAAFEVEVKKNEDAANALKKTCAEQEQAIKEARTKRKLSCSGASKVLLNTLSKEVHTTVGKMKEKEEQVNKLNLELDVLRRELDDVVREKDERIEELETQTRQAEEKMKILKGSFSFSDDEASTPAEKIKPSPFFGRETIADYEETSYFQDSPELGSF